jgi:hypothetical protein
MRRRCDAIFCRFVQSIKHHSATASQLLKTNAIDSAGTTLFMTSLLNASD